MKIYTLLGLLGLFLAAQAVEINAEETADVVEEAQPEFEDATEAEQPSRRRNRAKTQRRE
jgi:hypothetical protein